MLEKNKRIPKGSLNRRLYANKRAADVEGRDYKIKPSITDHEKKLMSRLQQKRPDSTKKHASH